jgi:hypothetical protein
MFMNSPPPEVVESERMAIDECGRPLAVRVTVMNSQTKRSGHWRVSLRSNGFETERTLASKRTTKFVVVFR